MKVWSEHEWLRWGEDERNFIGFFSPIEIEGEDGVNVVVSNKYGKYQVNIETYEIATIDGTEYDVLSEVAKYGMGFKWWIDDTEERAKAEMKRLGLEE